MRRYWEVAKRGYRRRAAYRAAMVAGLFTNTVFAFIKAYVLLALYRNRTDIGGFDAVDAVTFVFAAEVLGVATGTMYMWEEISLRVRTGDVVTDLYRPIDFQGYWLADDLGRALYQGLTRGVPQFAVGALVFDLRLPEAGAVPGFAVAFVIAVVISYALRFLVNVTAFWLGDVRGLLQLSMVVQAFFAGWIVPIVFYPGWLETVARALPFAGLIQVPAEVFMGKHTGLDLVATMTLQLVWAVALLALGRLVLAAAIRRLVVQGG